MILRVRTGARGCEFYVRVIKAANSPVSLYLQCNIRVLNVVHADKDKGSYCAAVYPAIFPLFLSLASFPFLQRLRQGVQRLAKFT